MKRFAQQFGQVMGNKVALATLFGGVLAALMAAPVEPYPKLDPLNELSAAALPAPLIIDWAHGAHGVHQVGAEGLIALPDYLPDEQYGGGVMLPNSTVLPEVPDDSYYRAVGPNFGLVFKGDPPPPAVEAVVMEAVRLWDSVLAESAPVDVSFSWVDMQSPNILGYAGPTALYNGDGLGAGEYLYPAAVANTILGRDIDQASVEAQVVLNSQVNWYIGTVGTPSSTQLDLLTVVLHEIGHGMGFVGSASGQQLAARPFMYDTQVMNGDRRLVDEANRDSLLTSNSLSLRISESLTARLYSPSSWSQGSSFSHFDESAYPAGSGGALMTPSLRRGEVERSIDGYVLGVMARIGWPMHSGPVAPSLSASTTGDRVDVEINPNLDQPGPAPDSFKVEWIVDGRVLNTQVFAASITQASLGGLRVGEPYFVRVTPLLGAMAGTASTVAVSITDAQLSSAPRAVSTSSGLRPRISWNPPEVGNPESYVIEFSTDGGPWMVGAESTSLSASVQVPEGVHQFRVAGINGYGRGAYGYSVPTGFSATVVRPLPLDGQLARLYTAYFARIPDESGFSYWRDRRAGGRPLQEISQEFASSAEFVAAYGLLDDKSFVELVYRNVLGRPSDAEGRAHWVNQLASGAKRGEVMVGFSESGEFIAATGTRPPGSPVEAELSRLFFATFLRYPDQTGLDYWVRNRAAGMSLVDIGSLFADSAEFVERYGNMTDQSFVRLVYNNVLGREPDDGGLSYWLGRLASGTSRGAMMVDFSASEEFVAQTGTIPQT